MRAQLAFTDAEGGTSSVESPNRILPNQVARMVNCAIVNGLPRTRPGIRVVPLTGDAAQFVRENNVQGSIAYNPSLGQGGLTFGKNKPMIALASGGRKFGIQITGPGDSATGAVNDITNGLFTSSQLHLVWLNQWENYLLAQDGQSGCFIWDSVNPAYFSTGYNTIDKEKSKVPGGGSVMVYAHGRGSVVVTGRFVLTGDIIHKSTLASAANLLAFTEQAYWATGQYFLPPTEMGPITAAGVLPTRNTQHGHGEVIFHCEGGIFSLNLNVFPRSSWANTEMIRILHSEEGATGPYALALFNGDQIFRSVKGVQTIRSAAATNLEGDTNQPISSEVDLWLRGDHRPYLRFASVVLWRTTRRFLATTGPVVHGRHRWHRGAVSRSFDTSPGTQAGNAAWEGLWTLPPKCAGITQFVPLAINRNPRLFAWTRGNDETVRLVEFLGHGRQDILDDDVPHDIRAQVLTRRIDAGRWWIKREYSMGRLYFCDIESTVRWAVWVRPYEAGAWAPWNSGTLTANLLDLDNFDLTEGEKPSHMIPLGNVPNGCAGPNQTRGLQCLIRWEGVASLEGIRVTHGEADLLTDEPKPSGSTIEFTRTVDTVLTDFEYSDNETANWLP